MSQSQQVAVVDAFKRQMASQQEQFKAALPSHIPPERFVRVVQTAVITNPDLLNADRVSLLQSSMRAAQDGLLPDGREGALVVFKTKAKDGSWKAMVQWMPMVFGILKKLNNAGEIDAIDAYLVHENDKEHFQYRIGLDPEPIFAPDWWSDRGAVVGVYAVARLKSGARVVEIMNRHEVEKVRAVSRAKDSGPWVQWWGEMAKKTVLRRLSKRLPMSADIDAVMDRDEEISAAEKEAVLAPQRNPLDDGPLAIEHDEETGEIIENTENGAEDSPPSASEAASAPANNQPPPVEFAETDAADPFAGRPMYFRFGWEGADQGVPRDRAPVDLDEEERADWQAGHDAWWAANAGPKARKTAKG